MVEGRLYIYIYYMYGCALHVPGDNRFPTIEDDQVEKCCRIALELSKSVLHFLINSINDASKKETHNKRD